MSNKSNQPLEFRRLFLLADLYIDCWDASRGGLHSGLGTAYVGEGKGMGGFSIHEFWKGAISDALGQNRSVHEIAGLINKDFKRLVSDHEFEILSEEYALDIRDRQPNGKGTFEAREFREKLYGHYIRYLQDCIDYQEGEGFRDWSRLSATDAPTRRACIWSWKVSLCPASPAIRSGVQRLWECRIWGRRENLRNARYARSRVFCSRR